MNRPAPIGRYAPSPTGDLHLGNLRTAIAAHDDIRDKGGTFILRIEDTDAPRNVAGAESRILEDLSWLGITWDEGPDVGGPAGPYKQSDRQARYVQVLHGLIGQDLVYPCTCSRTDLQSGASAPHGPEGSIYPGTCRPAALSAAKVQDIARNLLDTPGRDHGLALRLNTHRFKTLRFIDELAGPQKFEPMEFGDFVILRRDGLWAYQFVCAVDDALMGITRVVRGSDLLTSTPRQVAIMAVLGFTPPIYRHLPLAADSTGRRLSKRDGSQSLKQLKEKGLSPQDVRRVLCSLEDVRL